MRKISVPEREREIVKFIEDRPDGVSLREIYDAVSKRLDDTISRPAYYKVLDRLVAGGMVEILREDPERGRLYGLTPTLNAQRPITLDDIYELLPYLDSASEGIARLIDARDYFEENRKEVLRRAAEALLNEDPVDLFQRMIVDKIQIARADQAMLQHQHEDTGEKELEDATVRNRLRGEHADLEHVAYRGLSLPPAAIDIPAYFRFESGDKIEYDPKLLTYALRRRVFGATFIREVDVSPIRGTLRRGQLTVSGSDGSMHAGTLALQTAGGYVEDYGEIITFNNSTAYIRLSQQAAADSRIDHMVYSEPMTRETLDNPANRGMVLAQFMYHDLSESEYEHMTRCATDVVQFRVDEKVFGGTAYDLTTKDQIPKPQVHMRDGTITPQDRYFMHYTRLDAYGEIVREGIRLERKILERIVSGKERAPVFAGAVKTTHTRLFGLLLNWYISRGSAKQFGTPIEPKWDLSRAAAITDNAAMTSLLSALPNRGRDGKFYVTCAFLRRFHALTEFYSIRLDEPWLEFFEEKKQKAIDESSRFGTPLTYHATVDLSDDDYIVMCERADYVSFYIGHTDGDPPPMIPRYEFLMSLRDETADDSGERWREAAKRIDETVTRIVDALDAAGLAIDRDHNFLSGKTLVKLLPFPIQQAHEYSKTLGRKLEAELKSVVIGRLIELKRLRAGASSQDVAIRPVTARRYLENIARSLGPGGDPSENLR
jgi:hypothetical protein